MKIAVIGSGIAGLSAAYVLSRAHDVSIFEATGQVGGHTNTVTVGPHEIDTGFIVHNEANYPLLTRLFRELGVRTQPSEMSFSLQCSCGLTWSSKRPWRAGASLLREIARFLQTARAADARGQTFDEYLRSSGYSDAFRWHYLVPMTSALWSTPPGGALSFPADLGIRFFEQHRMLGFRRHRWRTVTGGSRRYIGALLERTALQPLVDSPVVSITRTGGVVELRVRGGEARRFDAVVVATHAPQALALLTDPSDEEHRLLGGFQTARNEAVLHTDDRFVPVRMSDRSSWNYQASGCGSDAPLPTMTYSLTRLQRLATETEFCVTLNRTAEIDPGKILRVIPYAHPQLTLESVALQCELPRLNGPRSTAFAGAWQGYGFHEDGIASGVRAAQALGVRW
jgi:uncharacterized protein